MGKHSIKSKCRVKSYEEIDVLYRIKNHGE